MRKLEFTFSSQKHGGKASKLRLLLTFACLVLLAVWGHQAQAQCPLVCNDNVNVSLPGPTYGCSLEITVDMVLEDPDTSCPTLVNLMTLQGLPLATSPFVNASHIGQSFIYQVVETNSGNSCWGTIKVEDKLGPTITNCGDFTMPCIANHKPTSEGGNAPMPTFTDCSQIVNISYSDVISDIACPPQGSNLAGTASAVITRTWTATDKYGYSSTCTQHITLLRLSLQNYTPVCPQNVNLVCGSGNPNTHPDATGYPTVAYGGTNWPIKPGGEGFCEMAVSYSDEVFNICGGGKKILRTWTIYDWCLPVQIGLNPWACIQVIKIEDTVPPVIVCPAPIVQGSASSGCVASLTLPPATVTDACSQFTVKVLTPFGVVNGNGGLLLNVPVGVHQITYAATDACGNLGTCTTTLTVKDDTPPVAVCDEHTTVALTADGTAIVSAVTFDDGSLDNCAIDYFKARRMASSCGPETLFDDYISFSCCDVGETIMVAMRVYDKSGNFNECMVEVNVQDKIDPTITCPPDKTIECTDPVPVVTDPVVWDNCPGVTWTVNESDNISSCGVGTITRVFTATDHVGRKASCTQKISVINSYPFNATNITWPLDYYTNQCDPETNPNDLPPGYDRPIITEDQCDLIAVTFTDQLLPTNPPACFKILRKWIVINWCVYNPNQPNSPGYWEHVQIIKVQDEEKPVLTCPGNIVAPSSDANCAFGYVAVDAATATDCSPNIKWTTKVDYYSNNSIDVVGTNPNLSGQYPFGKHTVTITAEDFCGNASTCTFTIEVVDGKKPTPICINGLAAELMADPAGNGGMVTLTPQMFNAGSFDNCTSKPNLQLQISPSVFTCTEVGINVVTMWVTDEAGNADYCETWVDIQDNMVNCPGNLSANVAGKVADPAGQGVNGVMLDVSGNGPLTAPVTTSATGSYQFVGMEQGYDYTLTPAYNTNPLNGVTTYDLVLITRHILNVELLGSPFKMIAADVNKSGSVTTADIVELRKLILQIQSGFNNNTSWRFVDKTFQFPNPANPFQTGFPEFYNVNDLSGNLAGIDFVAVKIGDVNGSAATNFNGDPNADRSSDGELTFVIDEQIVSAGKTYRVAFKAKNFKNLLGYQFALRFDPQALELTDIQPGDLTNLTTGNFGLTRVDEGIITTSWDNSKNTLQDDNTVLFTLIFKANTNTALSDALEIALQSMRAEAYQDNGGNTSFLGVNLAFNNPETATATPAGTDFELFQNNPNPFRDETVIGFRLPESGIATLTVFDMSGKVLTVVSENYSKGYHEITLTKKDLGAPGILFYQLETATQTATGKMVRL